MNDAPKSRAWLQRTVNVASLWAGSFLAGIGFAVRNRTGEDSSPGTKSWGMGGEVWNHLHWILALLLFGLLALNLFLHRRRLHSATCPRPRFKLCMVAAVLVAALLLIVPSLPRVCVSCLRSPLSGTAPECNPCPTRSSPTTWCLCCSWSCY